MKHDFGFVILLSLVSIMVLVGCTAAPASTPTGNVEQPTSVSINSQTLPGIQTSNDSGSGLITLIPITVAVVTITPFQDATPDRVSTAVAGTRIAFEEKTAIAATLTALAPQPTITPFEFPTVPPATVPPRPTQNYASIINQHTQLCLTAQGGSVVQSNCVQSPNQLWRMQMGNGPFQLASQGGSCLSFSDVDIVASACNGSPAWTLRRWGDYNTIEDVRRAAGKSPHGGPNHPHPAVLEYGTYFQIVDGGNCVDVDGWNHNDGGRIIFWPCNGTIGDNANQLWAFYR